MNNNFFDGLDELYHRAKLGDDRTTRAGCRCENVVFVTVFFLFVCLAPSPERRAFDGVLISNKHCVAIYRPIWTLFSAFFHR